VGAFLHLDPESLPTSIALDQPMSDEAFEALCFANDFFTLERTREGEIIVHAPAAAATGDGNAEIAYQLRAWWKTHRNGRVFDSSTGFFLADSSMLNPDAAYLLPKTMKGVDRDAMDHFPYRCPDFVIELLSKSDRLSEAKAKMERWIENGASLAWLIDPYQRRVLVYAPGEETVTVTGKSVEGTGPVEGFTLDLSEVWSCHEI
jgi:Uma2 family endonuclease